MSTRPLTFDELQRVERGAPLRMCAHCVDVMDQAQKRGLLIKLICPTHGPVEVDGRNPGDSLVNALRGAGLSAAASENLASNICAQRGEWDTAWSKRGSV